METRSFDRQRNANDMRRRVQESGSAPLGMQADPLGGRCYAIVSLSGLSQPQPEIFRLPAPLFRIRSWSPIQPEPSLRVGLGSLELSHGSFKDRLSAFHPHFRDLFAPIFNAEREDGPAHDWNPSKRGLALDWLEDAMRCIWLSQIRTISISPRSLNFSTLANTLLCS